MWICPKCRRIFAHNKQGHSCRRVELAEHFKNKALAKTLFDALVLKINTQIGQCRIISLPCCVHLFGRYDFLALLPKKDRLEVRLALNRELESPRLKLAVPLSASTYKNCVDIFTLKEVDAELMGWLKQSYYLKD